MEDLLEKTKAELEVAKAQLRAPVAEAQKKVDALKLALQVARIERRRVKAETNAMRLRGPFFTRTASVVRLGAAMLAGTCALHVRYDNPWLTLAPLAFLLLVAKARAFE